jgi:3-deoxy-D-manno-octulosonate 8-phosphate phosphatase (KDO 8-P phosphatase)
MSMNTGLEHLRTGSSRTPPKLESIDPSRLRAIKVIFFDCDGVMTDGRVWVDAQGNETKAFSVIDGHGVAMLREAGVQVGMITRSPAGVSNARAKKLKFDLVRTGVLDKVTGLREALKELSLDAQVAAFMGDDLPDIGPMREAALSITVPTARPEVLDIADAMTHAAPGSGAVREVCDLLITARKDRP